MSDSSRTLFRARWIAPDPCELERVVDNGALLCADGRVVSCGKFGDTESEGASVVDLGDVVVLPGLINAHTHLELTALAGRLKPTNDFAQWVRDLVAVTRSEWIEEDVVDSVRRGVEESLAAGVTCVGDIATDTRGDGHWPDASIRALRFVELFGLDPALADERLSEACGRLLPDAPNLRMGLSPHAPTTVSPELLRASFEYGARSRAPVCIHAAETRDEEAFCLRGEGPLVDLMRDSGMLGDWWRAPGMRPIPYLAKQGLGRGASLIAHANYANNEEVEWLARNDVSVVWCPSSHRFFEHDEHPLRQMLKAGVNVCLGTDSRASGDSLDVLGEARLARELFPELTVTQLLAMVTTNAARALDWSDEIGSLASGKHADFVAFDVDQGVPSKQVLDVLLTEAPTIHSVWIDGAQVPNQ